MIKGRKLWLIVMLLAMCLCALIACSAKSQRNVTFTVDGENYGTKQVVEDGGKVAKPEDPAKASDAQFTYTFSGWYNGNAEWNFETDTVTSDLTLTAKFDKTTNKYTVVFKNGDEELQKTQVEYGTIPQYTGETPTKADDEQNVYTFSGWNPTVEAVKGEVTYNAQFSSEKKSFTVKFLDPDDKVLSEKSIKYGEEFTVPTPETDEDTYVLWKLKSGEGYGEADEITDKTVKGDITYKAEYKTYLTVKYLKPNNDELASYKVKAGDIAQIPANLTKEHYAFAGFEIKGEDGSFSEFGGTDDVNKAEVTKDTTYRIKYNCFDENMKSVVAESGFVLDFDEGDLVNVFSGNCAVEYVYQDGERLMHLTREKTNENFNMMLRSFDHVFTGGKIYEVKLIAKSGSMSGGQQLVLMMNSGAQQIFGSATPSFACSQVGKDIVYSTMFAAHEGMDIIDLYISDIDLYVRSISIREVKAGADYTFSGSELTLTGKVNGEGERKSWETVTVSDSNPVAGLTNGTYCHVNFYNAEAGSAGSERNSCYFAQMTPYILQGYKYSITVKGYAVSGGNAYLGSFEANGNGDAFGSPNAIAANQSFEWTTEVSVKNGVFLGIYADAEGELYITSVTIKLVGAAE